MQKYFTNIANMELQKSIKKECLSSRSDEHETCHQTSFSPLSPENKFQIWGCLFCVEQKFAGDAEQNTVMLICILDKRYFCTNMTEPSQKLVLEKTILSTTDTEK